MSSGRDYGSSSLHSVLDEAKDLSEFWLWALDYLASRDGRW